MKQNVSCEHFITFSIQLTLCSIAERISSVCGKNVDFKIRREKIPMSAGCMSRKTTRAYLRMGLFREKTKNSFVND